MIGENTYRPKNGVISPTYDGEQYEIIVPEQVGAVFLQPRKCGDFYCELNMKSGPDVAGFGPLPPDAFSAALAKVAE